MFALDDVIRDLRVAGKQAEIAVRTKNKFDLVRDKPIYLPQNAVHREKTDFRFQRSPVAERAGVRTTAVRFKQHGETDVIPKNVVEYAGQIRRRIVRAGLRRICRRHDLSGRRAVGNIRHVRKVSPAGETDEDPFRRLLAEPVRQDVDERIQPQEFPVRGNAVAAEHDAAVRKRFFDRGGDRFVVFRIPDRAGKQHHKRIVQFCDQLLRRFTCVNDPAERVILRDDRILLTVCLDASDRVGDVRAFLRIAVHVIRLYKIDVFHTDSSS